MTAKKKPAAKKVTAKKPAAKKTAAKKTAAKKPAAKKTTPKKPAARKTTPKKPAAPASTNFMYRQAGGAGDATLTEDEQKAFVERMVAESPLLSSARKFTMRRARVEIPRMKIGARVTTAAGLARLFTSETPRSDFESVVLSSSRVVLPWTVTEEFLDDNPGGDDAAAIILRMMAIQAGNDIEDLAVNGDESSKDSLLRANDGWVKQATQIRRITLRRRDIQQRDVVAAVAQIPAKYRGKIRRLSALVGPNSFMDALEGLAVVSDSPTIGDLPLHMAPYLSDTSVLVTNPTNLVLGVQTGMVCRMTAEGKNAIDRNERYFALHMQVDFAIQNQEAAIHLYLEPWWETLGRGGVAVHSWIMPKARRVRRLVTGVTTKTRRAGRHFTWNHRRAGRKGGKA